MEQVDALLDLVTKHWKIITGIGVFFVSGGYVIARYRTSGMHKMVKANGELLDDLSTRLHRLRTELENARDELSDERSRLNISEEKVRSLERKVHDLEQRERELLLKINVND